MDPFKIDLGLINSIVNPDRSRVPFKGNEDKFVRIAFDLFKMKDNSCEDLWKVQADDDGNEYLVRTYEVEDDVKTTKWSVALDKTASNLTIAYKGMPIHRLVTASYGINNENDALILRDAVQEKLSTSKEFIKKFAAELSPEKQKSLMEMGVVDPADLAMEPEQYPEEYHGPGFKKDENNSVNFDLSRAQDLLMASISLLTRHLDEMKKLEGGYTPPLLDVETVLSRLYELEDILKGA